MSAKVDAAFEEFLTDLRTTPAETLAARNHRASIEAKLIEAFGMQSFFRTGSFGNGTNISGYSDVDYFAVIPPSILLANSSDGLTAVAEALRDRFPNTPNIRVHSPGVRIPFMDGAEATEVVPAHQTGVTNLGYRQFDIPDGNGGWKFSAPGSHNAYVSKIDADLGGKVKPLIRFIKAWKFLRNVPIKSFYLEIRTALYASGESAIVYDVDIARLLSLMLAEQLANLPDPRFPNDRFVLQACNTVDLRIDALSKLQNAATWAAEAVQHSRAGRVRSAFNHWSLVFNNHFPPLAQ